MRGERVRGERRKPVIKQGQERKSSRKNIEGIISEGTDAVKLS